MSGGKVVQMETRELAALRRSKIRPGHSDEWNNQQLYVPPLPPTNLRGCHLIKIQYDVYVSLACVWISPSHASQAIRDSHLHSRLRISHLMFSSPNSSS